MIFAIFGSTENPNEMPLIAFVKAKSRLEACEKFAQERYSDGISCNGLNPKLGYHMKGWPSFRLQASRVTLDYVRRFPEVIMQDLQKNGISCKFDEPNIITARW